jgi:hypothetical protein
VKQADLQVGQDYAFPIYKPYDAAPLAARVRVLSLDGGGKATVQVVDPGEKLPKHAWGATPVKRNEKRQVSTRNIACPWEAWASHAASIDAELEARAAERQQWHDDYERKRADRVTVDPDRALPDEYDEEFIRDSTDAGERAVLAKAYVRVRGFGPYATVDEISPLLVDLPVRVLRDILATNENRQPGAPGTVAAVFTRSAALLEDARIASIDRSRGGHDDIPRPRELLGEADVAFVSALREQVVASGGNLLLPPVPLLPDWVSEEDRQMAPAFGWLRLAVADTSGEKLHSPSCHIVRSRSVPLADHMPWWRVMVESSRRVCGVCDGPCVRDLVPLAGFAAAVDVWHHRGRDRIEQWQQAAFQRLLAVTSVARAEALEPDITLAHRIIDALSENAPGDEGWGAYALLVGTNWNGINDRFKQLPPAQQEAARVLARDRLATLEAVLPASKRPLRLPQSADERLLRDRYDQLSRMLDDDVPQLDRLLFTLPGARRGW